MEKIETTIKEKENQPAPAPTACRRCGSLAAPKFITLLGWRQQDHCDTCGAIIAEEREKREMEEHRKMTIETYLARSGIVRGILAQMTLENFNPQLAGKAYDIAKEYAEGFGRETTSGLMLYGKAGSGKTHLAVAIARHIIEQKQIQVRFARVVDLLAEIRKTFNENEQYRTENESDLIQRYASAPLLIIDDLGAEKTTDWVRQILYQIIDERWIEQKPIIVTSNLNLEELEARFEERIASRVAGMCRLVESRDYDYRIKKSTP